jgi:hypothetical protein
MNGRGMNSTGSGSGQVLGSCMRHDNDNDITFTTKFREILD